MKKENEPEASAVSPAHTPGPWRAAADAEVVSDHGYICLCGDADDHGNETDKANANLIAAAPELLAAVELMIELEDNPTSGVAIDAGHLAILKRAVAKAKGAA